MSKNLSLNPNELSEANSYRMKYLITYEPLIDYMKACKLKNKSSILNS
jgi:hypothetical protein